MININKLRFRGDSLPRPREKKPTCFNKNVNNGINGIDFYDNVGSNGIFGANPSVVKFAGFEIRKTHTQKVRLINLSAAP